MTKQAHIIGDIQRKIDTGTYRAGQPLPTQKMLAQHYGVALGTVRQALGRLASCGILESRRGQGTIVSAAAAPLAQSRTSRQLGLLSPADLDAGGVIIGPILLAIQRLLAQDAGFELNFRLADDRSKDSILKWAAPLCGILVRGAIPLGLVEHLKATGKPVVIMGELQSGECPSWASQVTVDIDMLLGLAVHFAHSLGHRRMLLVRSASSYYQDNVGQAFRREVQQLGYGDLCGELLIESVNHGAELIQHLAAAKLRPTVVIVEGGLQANHHLYALEKAGWQVPDQLGVLAINSLPQRWLCTPQLSRVESPNEQVVDRLVHAIHAAIDKGIVTRERIAPRLVWGDTCARVEETSLRQFAEALPTLRQD